MMIILGEIKNTETGG